ncbi:MAG: dockerin type I domain-containing protein [Pseudomonadota bacterium]
MTIALRIGFVLLAGWVAVSAASATPPVMPLLFAPNHGQATADWQFVANSPRSTVAIGPTHFAIAPPLSPIDRDELPTLTEPRREIHRGSTLHVSFINANASSVGRGEGRHSAVSHYLQGNDTAAWKRNVPNYEMVRYPEVYRGIDLVFRGDEQRLRYDFELSPHADTNDIAIQFPAGALLSINAEGALVLKQADGELVQHAPKVFTQKVDGTREYLAARYTISATNVVTFDIDTYDQRDTLVIDPTIEYTAFINGSGAEQVFDIKETVHGLLVVGITSSFDLLTVNPVQNALAAANLPEDIFIRRYSPETFELEFSTYYGGSDSDTPWVVVEAENGDIVLAGATQSPDFPTQNGFDSTFAGGDSIDQDAFVTRLSRTGDDVVFSTYVGGFDARISIDGIPRFGRETIRDMVLHEPTNRLYLTGNTGASDFPVTDVFLDRPCFENSSSDFFAFRTDAFIMEMDAQTGAIYTSFCFGGEGRTAGRAVMIDPQRESIFVAGHTYSPDFPTTPDAFQESRAGTELNYDGYLTRFDMALDTLEAATYFGGSNDEFFIEMQLDSNGSPIVSGSTRSDDLPISDNAFQKINPALDEDQFLFSGLIASLDRELGDLNFSSYLGGQGDNDLWALRLDSHDRIYIAGYTEARDYPLKDALQHERGAPYSSPRPIWSSDPSTVVTDVRTGTLRLVNGEYSFNETYAVVTQQATNGGAAANRLIRQRRNEVFSVAELGGTQYASSAVVTGNVALGAETIEKDFVIGNCNGPHRVYVGDTAAGFSLTDEVPSPVICVVALEFALVDDDSLPDLVISDGQSLYFHPGDGVGRFGEAIELPITAVDLLDLVRTGINTQPDRQLVMVDRGGPDKLINFFDDTPVVTELFGSDSRTTRAVGYFTDFQSNPHMWFSYETGLSRAVRSEDLPVSMGFEFGDANRRLDAAPVPLRLGLGTSFVTLETDSAGQQAFHLYDYKEEVGALVELTDQKMPLAIGGYTASTPSFSGISNGFFLFNENEGTLNRSTIGALDIVVSVLNKDASALRFSTYLGGAGVDRVIRALEVPRDGRIVIGGDTVGDSVILGPPASSPLSQTSLHGFVLSLNIDDLLDNDSDSFTNDVDNCTDVSNADQFDTDGDGYGNQCDGDFNQDGIVNFADLLILREAFNANANPNTDLNIDGVTNFLDLSIFSQLFLRSPGPAAIDLD